MLVLHIGLLILFCGFNDANVFHKNNENDHNIISDVSNYKNDLIEKYDTDSDENDALSWDEYIESLIYITKVQFDKLKNNIQDYYQLDQIEINAIHEALNDTDDYELMVQQNLNTFIKLDRFNGTSKFMIDFMDLNNVILENVLDMKLKTIKGKLQVPTKWYQQTYKDKILRQEMKTAIGNIENYMCDEHILCKDNIVYTDYVKEWIRLLLNKSPKKVKHLFVEIPKALDKYANFVKSTMKSLSNLKSILNSGTVLRDTLDFVDEVITNKDNIIKKCPDVLKKSAEHLLHLFKEINLNYDMNEENADLLDEVTDMILKWMDGKDTTMKLFDIIIEDMNLNYKTWPMIIQNKIDHIWFDIISL